MDCCNYMQYRHHQPYYGSQMYHEPFPPYHGDYYGPPMYHDYYGNTPYYPSQYWQGTSPFHADYSYNPKEARIRKAMREAMRDRSIGASPMLPRPSARRVSHGWIGGLSHEELIMSAAGSLPSPSLRPSRLESPAAGCFPISGGSGNGQFMPPMSGGYGKLEGPLPPSPSPGTSVHSEYMQPNPLAQLQQQAEMWHNYPDMRSRPSSNPYMIPDQMTSEFHHHPTSSPEMSNPLVLDKRLRQNQTPNHQASLATITTGATSCLAMTPPHSNENVPPDDQQNVKNESGLTTNIFEKTLLDPLNVQPLMETNNLQQQQRQSQSNEQQYLQVYDSQNLMQQYEKPIEECKMKKPLAPPQNRHNVKKRSPKPLPDFNEAFGSTERGRFQSPPDPRLAPLDFFFDENPQQIKFEEFQL